MYETFFLSVKVKTYLGIYMQKKPTKNRQKNQKTFHYFWEEIEMVVPLGMKTYIVQACIENALSWLFLFIYSILIATKITQMSAISFHNKVLVKQNHRLNKD